MRKGRAGDRRTFLHETNRPLDAARIARKEADGKAGGAGSWLD